MPLTFGYGIYNLEHSKNLFRVGVETISIDTGNFLDLHFSRILAEQHGFQPLVATMDIKNDFLEK